MTKRIRQRFWLLVLDALDFIPTPWPGAVCRVHDFALVKACDATDWGDGAGCSGGSGEEPW